MTADSRAKQEGEEPGHEVYVSPPEPVAAPAEAPLQHFFTLPFALHLRPLPHVSFLAHQDSQDTSEAEQSDGASTSSHESNYRAGKYRLEPALQSVPPHSLSTISTLLERTGCLEAVPIWTQVISMLDKADDDVHFTNLRQFFDARFDSEGRLISDKKGYGDETSRENNWSGTGLGKKRTNSLMRHGSQGHHGVASPRQGIVEESRRRSNTSRSDSSPWTTRTRSKSRLGPSPANGEDFLEQSDGESDKVPQSPTRSQKHPRRNGTQRRFLAQSQSVSAPEIYISRNNFEQRPTETAPGNRARAPSIRPVRFRVRLDLHSVRLAPRPPKARLSALEPVSALPSKKQSAGTARQRQHHLGSSPDSHLEIKRIVSVGDSSNYSNAESLSLRPVTSPDSLRSQAISDCSQSDVQRATPAYSDMHRDTSPTKANGAGATKTPSSAQQERARRTMTGSSIATNLTSVFSTSSDIGDDTQRTGQSFGEQYADAKSGEKHRPSFVQRLMSFGSKKGSSSRRRSATSSVAQSVSSHDDGTHAEAATSTKSSMLNPIQTAAPNAPESTVVSSPLTIELPRNPSFSFAMRANDVFERRSRLKSAGEQSDWSNEEALDIGDDDASQASSSGWSKAYGRRKSSVGALPSNAAALQPVQEDRPFDDVSNASAMDPFNEEEGEEGKEELEWGQAGDFLSLLRRAAQTTLHVKSDQTNVSNEHELRTPKSSSTVHSLSTPPGSVEIEEKLRAEALLAPFMQKGHEENPESWWLCGSADPLPISFACALSQAMGWQGIMDLCYGRDSRCDKAGTFSSLGKAAELHEQQENDSNKVRSWVQAVSSTVAGDTAASEKPVHEEVVRVPSTKDDGERSSVLVGSPGHSEVAPSESASALGKGSRQSKMTKWMNKLPGRNVNEGRSESSGPAVPSNDDELNSTASQSQRNWQDWADLLTSITSWMEEYETCRVRNGMARELDRESPKVSVKANGAKFGLAEATRSNEGVAEDRVIYSSMASYSVPRCVVRDALREEHGFRRRHGIPEGLPVGPDGEEQGNYRWARKKLSSSHFTTPLLLGTLSLAYFYGQLAASDWTYNSSWELDYLEMCVFHSDIISTRFPSPSTSVVPFDQIYQPDKSDTQASTRAKTCPYPRDSAWASHDWHTWLTSVQSGLILVPAVSFQAWWTLIAILNGADGSGRVLDLQVKSAEEPFEALDDLNSIYI